MTKRKFLIILASALGAFLAAAYFGREKIRQVFFALRPRISDAPTGTLSESEVQTLLAFGEVLVQPDAFSEEEKEALRAHLSERSTTAPGYYTLYQRTVAFLESLDAKGFSNLEHEKRRQLIEKRGLTSYKVRTVECLVPFRRAELSIRSLTAPDLIGAYYRSAAGWRFVGYQTFPGRCGDLNRYTVLEA